MYNAILLDRNQRGRRDKRQFKLASEAKRIAAIWRYGATKNEHENDLVQNFFSK